MAAVTVGTQAVQWNVAGIAAPVVQNLGAGTVYIDWGPGVTTSTGLQIPVGVAYELPRVVPAGRSLWLISSASNTDVRIFGAY